MLKDWGVSCLRVLCDLERSYVAAQWIIEQKWNLELFLQEHFENITTDFYSSLLITALQPHYHCTITSLGQNRTATGYGLNAALSLEQNKNKYVLDRDCEISISCAHIFNFGVFQLVCQKVTLLALHVFFLSWWRTAIGLGDAYKWLELSRNTTFTL